MKQRRGAIGWWVIAGVSVAVAGCTRPPRDLSAFATDAAPGAAEVDGAAVDAAARDDGAGEQTDGQGPPGERGPQGEDDACDCSAVDLIDTPAMKAQAAVEGLGVMAAGASLYFTKPQVDEQGNEMACSFPPVSTEWTPPAAACDTKEGYVTSPPADWDSPGWQQIQVSMPGDHYYRYRFETAPDGLSITLMAEGDLDCDGTWSRFERVLVGHDDPGECWVSGNLSLDVVDPLE